MEKSRTISGWPWGSVLPSITNMEFLICVCVLVIWCLCCKWWSWSRSRRRSLVEAGTPSDKARMLAILNARGITCRFCYGRVDLTRSGENIVVCQHDSVFHHANCLAENASQCAHCGQEKMLSVSDWITKHEKEIREADQPIQIF